jgi:hypothetical protein
VPYVVLAIRTELVQWWSGIRAELAQALLVILSWSRLDIGLRQLARPPAGSNPLSMSSVTKVI